MAEQEKWLAIRSKDGREVQVRESDYDRVQDVDRTNPGKTYKEAGWDVYGYRYEGAGGPLLTPEAEKAMEQADREREKLAAEAERQAKRAEKDEAKEGAKA